tara:strand:+ start:743 stop:3175 length:2433 start_codon:yes stop_codon:yes gene_type:complete
MPAPVLGLQALLQALGTISVGGAVGYKAQKSLKDANIDVKDFEEPELRMLRALLMPTQAIGTQIKEDLINKKIEDKKEPEEQQSFDLVTKPMPKTSEDLISKSAPGLTGEGITLGPKAEDIEKVQEEIKQVTKPPITSTPIKPITTETFPAEPQQKPEPPVQPEIDVETKESFPEIKTMPIIYSMEGDKPKFKYPTEEEIKEYINEENKFWKKNIQQINEKNPKFSVENMPKVVEADKHFGAAAYTFQNYNDSKLIYMSPDEYLSLTKKYRPEEDKEQLGSKMNVKNLENILREGGELANIPTLYIKKPFEDMDTFEVVGQEGNHRAKAFKNLGYDKIPVVIEGYTRDDRKKTKDVFPTSITSDDDEMLLTKPTDFYDVITKEKLVKEEQPQAPALVGTNSQEGGKVIKDITAGVSAQKGNVVPSLLEQSKLAIPIKNLFEEDNQVINYKIGDTVGAYGKDVERSLDIEANVKPDFNIDKFGEVIKQRAKEFDQDAVFVAETVTKDSEGANVGFDIDFGSDLKMKEALNVGNSISRIAELDGFTFKVKNLDTSGTSLYLPQSKKDLELIEKTLKKYPVTEDIRKAGFIMPDGKMLNFSLRGGNVRDTEHRRVGFMVQEGYDGESFGPMYDWMMKTGGIRITGNQNRLFAEVAGKPTTTQINKIVEEYNTNRDKYDSMIIGVTIPGEGQGSSIAPRQDFGRDIGLNLANNLRNAEFRLPSENFYEVTGENANASDIIRKLQSTDIVGKTFTGIRQLNIPEFSNISPEEAFNKVGNLYNNMQEIIDSTNIKTLDKPKVKFYKTKVFKKGKDY